MSHPSFIKIMRLLNEFVNRFKYICCLIAVTLLSIWINYEELAQYYFLEIFITESSFTIEYERDLIQIISDTEINSEIYFDYNISNTINKSIDNVLFKTLIYFYMSIILYEWALFMRPSLYIHEISKLKLNLFFFLVSVIIDLKLAHYFNTDFIISDTTNIYDAIELEANEIQIEHFLNNRDWLIMFVIDFIYGMFIMHKNFNQISIFYFLACLYYQINNFDLLIIAIIKIICLIELSIFMKIYLKIVSVNFFKKSNRSTQ